ncbi:hypothetical protein EMPS_10737 [Entomortierella parvispora]|uniref:F-box domain-containing protein n=1 Tax=Entomortierella parvispora TaxID=205924 RepID=A0A9P3HL58_9FUNG|nr:hypothetical protein EMPS_10737 [Entomortierella parvispora]
MTNSLVESALAIWLIQDAIAATFHLSDLYNCALVSRAWNRIFTPSLWRVVDCPNTPKVPQDRFLLDPDSILHQPKFCRLVRELTIMNYGYLPFFQPLPPASASPPLSPIKEAGEKSPDQQGCRQWINGPDPAFPNLQVLGWFLPLLETWPPVVEYNLLQFLQVHQASLHSLSLELWGLNDTIFENLCSILENMPSLQRVALAGSWIQTSKQVQRFFWACRHLKSTCLPQESHSTGCIDKYGRRRGRGLSTNAAVRLCVYYNYNNQEPEGLFPEEEPVWTPIFEPTQIRSLNLTHEVERKFWIYVPVFRMCPFLERLELEVEELEGMTLVLRECLHSSCPLLKFLKITRERQAEQADQIPLHWSLGLLCPSIAEQRGNGKTSAMATFKPSSPIYWDEDVEVNRDLIYGTGTTASLTTSTSNWTLSQHICSGFRLKSFLLDGKSPSRNKMAHPRYGRPWNYLLDHHRQTLTNLDVSAIVMPFQEFVHLASADVQMPHLLSLRAFMVLTRHEWKSLASAILAEERGGVLSGQPEDQDPQGLLRQSQRKTKQARKDAILETVRFRPWTACRGLLNLDMKIDLQEPRSKMQNLEWNYKTCDMVPERAVLEYIVHEINQAGSLEKLTMKSRDMPWSPVLTLPVPARRATTTTTTPAASFAEGVQIEDESDSEDDELDILGYRNQARAGGYLDQFSNLRWLKEVTWHQYEMTDLTVQDAEWILEHWPRLYLLDVSPEIGATGAGFDLLGKRRPLLMQNSNWF